MYTRREQQSNAKQIKARGGLAQLGEHLLCKQGVVGSIPSSSTNNLSKQHLNGFAKGCLGVVLASSRQLGCSLTIHRVESALLAENAAGISAQANLAQAKLSAAAEAKCAVFRAANNNFLIASHEVSNFV